MSTYGVSIKRCKVAKAAKRGLKLGLPIYRYIESTMLYLYTILPHDKETVSDVPTIRVTIDARHTCKHLAYMFLYMITRLATTQNYIRWLRTSRQKDRLHEVNHLQPLILFDDNNSDKSKPNFSLNLSNG